MIDERAIVHPTAKIADNVSIGPWSLIGPNVEIGEGTEIASHVVVNGPTKIGKDNKFYQFASIGEDPQDKKYQGEDTCLEIGDRNTFRECCTINRGTGVGGGATRIGNDNLFMAYVHVAHDCVIANHTIFSNNSGVAGHVYINDHVTLAAFAGVHQFCKVGEHSFVARHTNIVQDLPPYMLAAGGYNATVYGLNVEGLKRRGFNADTLLRLRRAYKVIYRQGLTVPEALTKLADMVDECPEVTALIDFLQQSERGIVR
ncbi:acyl-ACP--UDP-N-acetylglucosamine O-acyltransferase [Piscirickettsia litoralis]|uniref:Acyl-[acyl-carrier-protein]--UDP-N-acetylglucosamine O-acyltransferase n=1 Tax=Piscirickettsia litoralis TaxID=1891921 RepID=A0ABX3A5Y5_9GAMM|nr:acyl-ACP--UDP-N-acetylglucosamine O-acyltransferase [Piscirickettsia litoralis]ODN43642.1 acyl-[acyl-carrier-protein]--UDP-N-acetylglucosamine O-acyltransferase [Piscirickettsia litoralis]